MLFPGVGQVLGCLAGGGGGDLVWYLGNVGEFRGVSGKLLGKLMSMSIGELRVFRGIFGFREVQIFGCVLFVAVVWVIRTFAWLHGLWGQGFI